MGIDALRCLSNQPIAAQLAMLENGLETVSESQVIRMSSHKVHCGAMASWMEAMWNVASGGAAWVTKVTNVDLEILMLEGCCNIL